MSGSDSSSSSSDDEVYNPAEEKVAATVTATEAAADPVADVRWTSPRATSHVKPMGPAASSVPGASAVTAQGAVSSAASVMDDLPMDSGGLRLHAIKGRVRCLCVNRQGTLLCAGGEDGQFVMWDFAADLPARRVQPTRTLTPFVNRVSGLQPIVAAHFSRDGSYVVVCQDGDCPAVVGAGGRTFGYCAMGERGMADVVQCKGHRAPVTAACAHAGTASRFFTGSQDGTARLWDQSSFERRSLYTVKHGSGQIMDTVVVEAVLSLAQGPAGGGGAVVASAGEDGCVQLWDTRAKYRPGGALAVWDVYAIPKRKAAGVPGGGSEAGEEREEVFEHHTGGMAELAGSVLAVRRGNVVQFLDLRRTDAALPTAKGRGIDSADCLACDAVVDMPFVTDAPPLVSSVDGQTLLACTSRAGFQHVVGGHVVCFDTANTRECGRAGVKSAWRAGKAEDDVLCAAMDGEGRLFAGLSDGDVVVRRSSGAAASQEMATAPVDRWLDSRPQRPEAGTGRLAGAKSTREEVDVAVDDLF